MENFYGGLMEQAQEQQERDLDQTIQKLHKMRGKDRVLIYLLIVVIVLTIGAGSAAFFLSTKEMIKIRTVQQDQFTEHMLTNQFLMSTIDWTSFRTKTVLFMRDQIISTWKRGKRTVNMADAYMIAEVTMRESEKYPYMSPFTILAMQYVESRFTKNAVSKMGAVGLNQIMPSTGRILCGYAGIIYSDSVLRDVRTSTMLAVKYIDVLYAQYGRWDLVFADYNGGPFQAYYYQKEKERLSEETEKYVPDVLAKKEEYDKLFPEYRVDLKIASQIIDTSKGR
jgi:soluble lytic murein transglycosylase-like protein